MANTNSTMADLYLMEALSKLEAINLSILMIKHMTIVMIMKNGKHDLAYGYPLNHVFEYFGVRLRRGIPGTIKQSFSQTTFVENECSEVKAGTENSQMLELIA